MPLPLAAIPLAVLLVGVGGAVLGGCDNPGRKSEEDMGSSPDAAGDAGDASAPPDGQLKDDGVVDLDLGNDACVGPLCDADTYVPPDSSSDATSDVSSDVSQDACVGEQCDETCRPQGVDDTCDAFDDDCDGETDEHYNSPTGNLCGRRPLGICAGIEWQTCRDGETSIVCLGEHFPEEEICDGEDNDCDGATDEDLVGDPAPLNAGVCSGALMMCVGAAGWAPPNYLEIPGYQENETVCDGEDNDCDGNTDENLIGGSVECRLEYETPCRETGTIFSCVQGEGVDDCMQPLPGMSVDNDCDGIDDDCDGRADDAYVPGPTACGSGVCENVGQNICRDGEIVDTCSPRPGSPELCDLIDNDCDGTTDEGFEALGSVCHEGQGACQSMGVYVCARDGRTMICSEPAGRPGTELCGDNVDNDCDGVTDEGFDNLGEPCVVGNGDCQSEGTWECSEDSRSSICNGEPRNPGLELCGDRVDNDCDGATDEGFHNVGERCVVDNGGCQSEGTWHCSADLRSNVCNAPPPRDPTPETCNNVDDDCDGATDEMCLGGGCLVLFGYRNNGSQMTEGELSTLLLAQHVAGDTVDVGLSFYANCQGIPDGGIRLSDFTTDAARAGQITACRNLSAPIDGRNPLSFDFSVAGGNYWFLGVEVALFSISSRQGGGYRAALTIDLPPPPAQEACSYLYNNIRPCGC